MVPPCALCQSLNFCHFFSSSAFSQLSLATPLHWRFQEICGASKRRGKTNLPIRAPDINQQEWSHFRLKIHIIEHLHHLITSNLRNFRLWYWECCPPFILLPFPLLLSVVLWLGNCVCHCSSMVVDIVECVVWSFV